MISSALKHFGNRVVCWLMATPSDKPQDKVEFVKSTQRLYATSRDLELQADELGRFIRRVKTDKKRRKANGRTR